MSRIFVCLTLWLLGSMAFGPALRAEERIAFSRLTDGYWQIWVMDPDGRSQKQVTFSAGDKRTPAWARAGEKIAFRTNNGQLFWVGLEGQTEEEILGKYRHIMNPHFSAAGDQLVFVRFDPRTIDISGVWISDPAGQKTTLLTREESLIFQPVISNRGDRIVFVKSSPDRQSQHLWIMNADGTDQRELTSGPYMDMLPAFSPDQKMIAFASARDGEDYEIYLLTVKNGSRRRLTHDPGLDTKPTFSPDGKRIAFVSNRSGSQQIWALDLETKELLQLTQEQNESIEPAWGEIVHAPE